MGEAFFPPDPGSALLNPTDPGEWELNFMSLFGDRLSSYPLLIPFAGIAMASHAIQTGFFPLS